jgi:thiol-disulfide isomerase/thioredoxin
MRYKQVILSLVLALLVIVVPTNAEDVLLNFTADWCSPCRNIAPQVDSLAAEGVSIQRINVDQNREIAQQYGVTSLPTFILIADGKERGRIIGANFPGLRRLLQGVRKTSSHTLKYVKAVGPLAAVVRIENAGSPVAKTLKGSGVLVRWGGRVVILTAFHVIRDARRLTVILSNGVKRTARVLIVDPIWDCAVISIGQPNQDGTIDGIHPNMMAMGQEAEQLQGLMLRSAGYGGNGKLAVNQGKFLGYRGSPSGKAWDWMAIHGRPRAGDSGGPIFKDDGSVVGIVCCSNAVINDMPATHTTVGGGRSRVPGIVVLGMGGGLEVIGTQAGRIHQIIDEAVKHE